MINNNNGHQNGIYIYFYIQNKSVFLEKTSTDDIVIECTDEETSFDFPGATTKNGLTTVKYEEDGLKGRFFP